MERNHLREAELAVLDWAVDNYGGTCPQGMSGTGHMLVRDLLAERMHATVSAMPEPAEPVLVEEAA